MNSLGNTKQTSTKLFNESKLSESERDSLAELANNQIL